MTTALRRSLGERTPSAGSIPRATVMIVDDDPIMCDYVAGILKTAHYLVIHAASVEQARSSWIRFRPKVAIVDLELGSEFGIGASR